MKNLLILLLISIFSQTTYSSKNVSIAYCIVGSARTLTHPKIFTSVKEVLIKGLGEGDIFIYLSIGDFAWYNPAITSDKNEVLKVKEYFNPVVYKEYDSAVNLPNFDCSKFDSSKTKCIVPHSRCCNEKKWFKPLDQIYGQLLRVKEGYQLVKDYEKAKGFQYDYIVKIRPDLLWIEPPPPITNFSDAVYYHANHVGQFGDMFVITPRRYSDAFFNAADMDDVGKCSINFLRSPECHFQRSVYVHGAVEKSFPFFFVLVRKKGGECFRWDLDSWHSGTEEESLRRIEKCNEYFKEWKFP